LGSLNTDRISRERKKQKSTHSLLTVGALHGFHLSSREHHHATVIKGKGCSGWGLEMLPCI